MAKMQGMKCKVFIVDTDKQTVLGGQRNATLNRSAETIDATSKDTEGYWKESLQGFKEWSIDTDGCYITDDEAYDYLEEKFENSENVDVIVIMGDSKTYAGNVVITDFPIELPYDDLVTYSLTFQGSGALVKSTVEPEEPESLKRGLIKDGNQENK